MTDEETTRYFNSFMEYIRSAEPLIWLRIKQHQIPQQEFNQAVRDWAIDITPQNVERRREVFRVA